MSNFLSKRIVLLLILSTIIFYIVTLVINNKFSHNQIRDFILEYSSKELSQKELILKDFLKNINDDMIFLSSMKCFKNFAKNNSSEDFKIFSKNFLKTKKYYEDMYFISNNKAYSFKSNNIEKIKLIDYENDEFKFFIDNSSKTKYNLNAIMPIKNQLANDYLVIKINIDKFINEYFVNGFYDLYTYTNSGEILYINSYHSQNLNITSLFKDLDLEVENFVNNKFVTKKINSQITNGLNFLMKPKQTFIDQQFNQNLNKELIYLLLCFVFFTFIFYYISKMISFYYLKLDTFRRKFLKTSLNTLDEYILYSKTDIYGNITHASNGFCKLSGYDKDELIGKPHSIVRHPLQDKEIFEDMWETIKKEKIWTGEIRNIKKNGETYWIKSSIAPDYDENGKLIGYVSIRENITAGKELAVANKNLFKLIKDNKQLLELGQEGIIITDKNFNVINFNSKSISFLNRIKVNENLFTLLRKFDKKEILKFENFARNLTLNNSNNTLMLNIRGYYFKIVSKKLSEDNQVFIINDVTQILKQKVYFENILNTSKSIIITMNDEKMITANKRFFEILDYKNIKEFNDKHKNISELFIDKGEGYIKNSNDSTWINKLVNNNSLNSNNVCIIDKFGHERIFHIEHSGKLFNNQEELISFNEITKLVKNRKLIQMQTKHAAMGEMVAMIAHQWRQPLTVLISLLTKLNIMFHTNSISKEKFNSTYEESTEIIHHLSKTINDFKNYFKDSNELELITIPQLIEKSNRFFEITLKNLKIDFIEEYEESLNETVFNINASIIVQVIINLIKNAIDAHKENTSTENKYIKVIVLEKDHQINISVQDNAGGIQEDIIEKIFDPYFSTKSLNGTGLGLYMSKTIIKNTLEGNLIAESLNNGASFTITFNKNNYIYKAKGDKKE